MLTSPIDNILVEKAKRQMHLRNGVHHRASQPQKRLSLIAPNFVPECGANRGRKSWQLRDRRRHHDPRLPEQGSRVSL